MRVIGNKPLSRDDIVALLTELGAHMDHQGLRAEMFGVGGAAIALAYNTRRATRDIDAIFEPKMEIYAAAAVIAERHDLPKMWLNDAVKGLLAGEDSQQRIVVDLPGIRVAVPSPEYLLALKVAAARVDRDADDIQLLAKECGLTRASEILDLTTTVIGSARPLEAKVQFLIEELFP